MADVRVDGPAVERGAVMLTPGRPGSELGIGELDRLHDARRLSDPVAAAGEFPGSPPLPAHALVD